MNDTCVCCGEYVVEGGMICEKCEKKYLGDNEIIVDKGYDY